jgi:hypothetical protein
VIVYQGSRNVEILIQAVSSGAPVTGLEIGDFTIKKWGPGGTSIDPIVLEEEALLELSNGYYVLTFEDSSLWASVGEHFITITGAFDPIQKYIDVLLSPINPELNTEECVIIGNVLDLGGGPAIGKRVSFRPADFPVAHGSSSIIVSDKIYTMPDAYGNFSVALLRGKTVIVEIENSGIRNQIEVPDQPSAVLLDLLPPIS